MNKYFILLFLAYFCRLVLNGHGERLTSLGYTPDWSQLEKYQKTITEFRFKHLLDELEGEEVFIDTDSYMLYSRLKKSNVTCCKHGSTIRFCSLILTSQTASVNLAYYSFLP